jgi:hypothetical protein
MMHPMGYICDKLQSFIKPSNNQNPPDLGYNNSNNVRTKNVPLLDISNAIISLNDDDLEPPSYREVRNESIVCYKKTILFNGYSDTLIGRPRI